MTKIYHSLNFFTEVDETHPIGMQLLALEKEMQTTMLQGMLKEMLLPIIMPEIERMNEGGSYAILKVAD